jgi:hypothetical protein
MVRVPVVMISSFIHPTFPHKDIYAEDHFALSSRVIFMDIDDPIASPVIILCSADGQPFPPTDNFRNITVININNTI